MTTKSPERDGGFTLLELLISIALIGIVMPALAAAFTVVLRTTPSVGERTDNAHTLQGIVTWLAQDIDSTPPTGFDLDPTTPSGCTLSPGTNLLRLEWSENVGSGVVRYVANYRHVLVGSSYFIQRVTCHGIGSGPLGNAVARSASSALPPIPVGWVAGQLPFRVIATRDAAGDVTLVSFEVQTLTGQVVRTDSAPKNPANTLAPTSTEPLPTAPVTTTSTTIPPTTTTTDPSVSTTTSSTSTTSSTTTTAPPCVILTNTLSAASMKNTDPNGNGNSATNVGVLSNPVTLTVTTSGSCTGLEARATTGAPNGELFRNFTAAGATQTVTFPGYPQGSSELWADGDRTIAVYSASGGPHASVTLEVK
jgi:prepilin-type N-terminal cleavage/methylation domain-containing protein